MAPFTISTVPKHAVLPDQVVNADQAVISNRVQGSKGQRQLPSSELLSFRRSQLLEPPRVDFVLF